MKSVTEFAFYNLDRGLKARAALTAEGKSPEEIQESLGTTFKLEGDKLKYFIAALEVAGQNAEGLSRVLVVSLNEGENAPPKAIKVDEMHFVPEFKQAAPTKVATKHDMQSKTGGGKGGGGKGGSGNRPKESPWGITPEQKAAKKAQGKAAAKPTT